jgi:uncharacterized protein YfaS (alpha-2-macroglobulin family)
MHSQAHPGGTITASVGTPQHRPPWSAALGLALFALLSTPAQSARVTSISPQGEVAEVRQIAVRFDSPAVAAGDPQASTPYTLACEGGTPAADARWADPKLWLLDLREPLDAGRRCTLQRNPGFVALDGTLQGPAEHRFSTGAPTVVSLQPYPGNAIAEDAHFLLRLNGRVALPSLADGAWCEVEGLGERIPVRAVEGEARSQVLRRHARNADPQRLLLLACQRPLPPATRVRLVWGPGIAAADTPGLVTKTTRRFEWKVRERFAAEFSCERENAQSACLPLRPMSLRFNAPVPRAQALAVRLQAVAAAGAAPAAVAAQAEGNGNLVDEIRFAPPFAENQRWRVLLPPGLRDDSGRALANAASFPLEVGTGALPPLAKFASAPFGILEAGRSADEPALLPLTLRHVQADLAGASSTGQVRIKHLGPATDDASLLRWLGRVQRWHESRLSARDAGRPQAEWTEPVRLTDARGRERVEQRERFIATRELSLLATEPEVRRADLPQLQPGSTPRATEVLGLPLPQRGLHVVEVSSQLLGVALLEKAGPMQVRTAALVTNLAVHFKRGQGSSLVWVTSLDRGRPVAGAQVVVNDCRGQALWNGSTDARGIAAINRGFEAEPEAEDDAEGDRARPKRAPCLARGGLFVSARHDGDLAFVFGDWQRGIEPWRFNIALAAPDGADAPLRRAHTVFDRTLLRAGETVSMKHFVRDSGPRGLALPAADSLPTDVVITHVGRGSETVLPLDWRGSSRSAETQWRIPDNAALGLYDVQLRRGEQRLASGSLRVEAFRVPLVDARLSAPTPVPVAPNALRWQAQLNALSGGPMAGAELELSALLQPRTPRFAGFEEFSFDPPRAAGAAADEDEEGEGRQPDAARVVADKLRGRTNAQGAAAIEMPQLPALGGPSELQAELRFTDPNGEVQTVGQRLPLWPSAVVLGLRLPSWAASRQGTALTVLVLDTAGRPLAQREVQVRGRLQQTLSTRQRIVGGFYAYDNRRQVRELGVLCRGRSDARGRLACDIAFDDSSAGGPVSGEVEFIASAADDAGRQAESAATAWITGGDELWFAQGNDDRIDLLPEQREVEPGQTARLQLRMPFREATALVTVEREGVIDARVMTLRGREPLIELPIPAAARGGGADAAASWAPNVVVSVLVLRGRLREAPWWSAFTWGWRQPAEWWRAFRYENRDWRAPTALVDLARPAYKLGVAQLRIGLAQQRLDVSVTPERSQYQVRQTVKTRVRVSHAGRPVTGAEIAFAAVDEGLLALQPNDSWDLLGALLQPRPWGVQTATAQGEVIGRRHYGRKALPPGGGGGRNPTRELFDTLLLWRGKVALDARGEAVIEVPLNDSLTSFRLVAIADAADASGADLFGHGSASVRVSQDLQLLPGLPPLVREGDSLEAGFTLRNTTARPLQVQATLKADVDGEAGALPAMAFPPQTVQLAAGAAQEVRWPLQVPEGATRIRWLASAQAAGNGAPGDRVQGTQAVLPRVPQRVWQATLQPLAGPLSVPLAQPPGALPGRSAVRWSLQAKLASTPPGLRDWFQRYPYSCLEQQASRAIALGDRAAFERLGGELPAHLDVDGLASFFPPQPGEAARGSDRLTAHLLASAQVAGWAWPAAAQNAMLQGLADFVDGRIERRFKAPRADLAVRKLAALAALARHGQAEPRHWGSIEWTPAVWPTSALLDAWTVLQRVAASPARANRLAEVQNRLRARLQQGSTQLRFSTEADDDWWWLMDGPDANAARLLLAVLDQDAGIDTPAWLAEAPALLQGLLARQRGGAWLTTTANVWGVLALQRFSARFESAPVGGRSSLAVQAAGAASAAAGSASHDWSAAAGGGSGRLPWPDRPATFSARHDGAGQPWLNLQALAAVPLQAPSAAGYRITRSVVAVSQQQPGVWTRGDVQRVRLQIEAAGDMAWVVVDDAVPAGATLLGSGLGRDSALATRGEQVEGAWPSHVERTAAAWRGYYEWLPRGRHVVEYTLRLNSAGRFGLPPTRVEAMYAPEVFGEVPRDLVEVRP